MIQELHERICVLFTGARPMNFHCVLAMDNGVTAASVTVRATNPQRAARKAFRRSAQAPFHIETATLARVRLADDASRLWLVHSGRA